MNPQDTEQNSNSPAMMQGPTPLIRPNLNVEPPQGTAFAILQENGFPIVNNVPLDGDRMYPEMDYNRLEILDYFTYSTDPVSRSYDVPFMANDHNGGLMAPRVLSVLCNTYADIASSLVFMAIKPQDTAGRFAISMIPYGSVSNDTTRFKIPAIIWDLAKTPILEVPLTQLSGIAHKPCRTTLKFDASDTDHQLDPDSGYSGSINIKSLTKYAAGSIYPDAITIYVFSRVSMNSYIPLLPDPSKWQIVPKISAT